MFLISYFKLQLITINHYFTNVMQIFLLFTNAQMGLRLFQNASLKEEIGVLKKNKDPNNHNILYFQI